MMKWKLVFGLILIMAFCSHARAAYPEVREYLLGDMDGFVYDGPGSVDDVYIDPVWLSYFNQNPSPDDDFDVLAYNHDVGFTFEYPLAIQETVTAATFTVAMRAIADAGTDLICLDGRTLEHIPTFEDLGWLPVSDTGVSIRELTLDDVLGVSFMPLVQDGQFSVQIRDDVAVDYAMLRLEVIPEPTALALLALGGLAVIRHRNRRPE